MFLIELIHNKLKKDLQKDLSLETNLNQIEINELIDKKLKSINLETILRSKLPKMIKTEYNYNDELCCARVWSSHYGNRCSKKRMDGKDYCCQHVDMIDKYGYLSLGRYDEKKPLVNEKGNLIPWYNYEILDMINILVEYIFLKLVK